MDAVEFIKERRRMYTGGFITKAIFDISTKAEDVVAEVEQWSREHPRRTQQVDIAAEDSGTWLRRIPPLGAGNALSYCSNCGFTVDVETPFCPWCGKKKQYIKEENELQ